MYYGDDEGKIENILPQQDEFLFFPRSGNCYKCQKKANKKKRDQEG